MIRAALPLFLLLALLSGEDDAYAAWSAGRPAEALPHLHMQAQANDRWDAWLDLGLCAAAAGRHGPAVVWLLEAERKAPGRPEPRQALAALGVPLPESHVARLGALALPGSGVAGVILAALTGVLLGYAVLGRRGRIAAALLGAATVVAIAPGVAGAWLDGRQQWVGTASDTSLLDSTGAPLRPVPAGSVVERLPGAPWNGRVAVRLGDGAQGWLAESDIRASP